MNVITVQPRKKAARAVLSVLFAILLAGSCYAQSVGWGLGYPVPGQAPQGMASREALLEHDAYFVGDGVEKGEASPGDASPKDAYLTFDAGYENGHMEKILDVLKKTETPAAFFLVGTYIRDNPALVKRMVEEGHIVANHTQTHPDMSAIADKASFAKELSQVEDIYTATTGQKMPAYYRPPRGVYNTENLKMAKELGYKTVFWSLAYRDWIQDAQPSREEAFAKLLPRAHPGMVLLLHSTSKTNAEILEDLIGKYREMGYAFKTLDQLTSR